jgi:hypothetical protein
VGKDVEERIGEYLGVPRDASQPEPRLSGTNSP